MNSRVPTPIALRPSTGACLVMVHTRRRCGSSGSGGSPRAASTRRTSWSTPLVSSRALSSAKGLDQRGVEGRAERAGLEVRLEGGVAVALRELAEHGLQRLGMGAASSDEGPVDAIARVLPAGQELKRLPVQDERLASTRSRSLSWVITL